MSDMQDDSYVVSLADHGVSSATARGLYAARGRRQARRPDVGRDDRQSRLERHRVHGHQDQQDGRAGRSSATTSTRTW